MNGGLDDNGDSDNGGSADESINRRYRSQPIVKLFASSDVAGSSSQNELTPYPTHTKL